MLFNVYMSDNNALRIQVRISPEILTRHLRRMIAHTKDGGGHAQRLATISDACASLVCSDL